MKKDKVNILGTDYKIEVRKISEDNFMKEKGFAGFCSEEEKLIVVADMNDDEFFPHWTDNEKENYRKKTYRHEIFHAFLNESGLSDNALSLDGAWAKNEEMIDWFAIQSPKIYKTFKELEVL